MFALGIDTFLMVVQEKNFTSAATKLHVAQSTVSQRLLCLEQEVGMKLVDRGKGVKHIVLTPSGEEFLKLAQEWQKIWKQSLVLKEQGPKLYLSIGATDSINTFLLPPVFESLNSHYPVVGLRLNSIHSWDLYAALEKGLIDIGLGLQELFYPNLICTKFFSTKMVIIRPACAEGQKCTTLAPTDLDPNQEVHVNWGAEFRMWHEKWWNPLSPSRFRVDYVHLALTLLKDHRQWLILPLNIAQAILKHSNYFIYEISDPPPPYCCYMITRKHKTKLTEQAISLFDNYLNLHITQSNQNLDIKNN